MTQGNESAKTLGAGMSPALKPKKLNLEEAVMGQGPNRRHWLHGARRWLIVGALAGTAQLAFADSEYAAAWGPSVGAMSPLLAATDQEGKQQTLDTLKGFNGLLFVFNRSVDW